MHFRVALELGLHLFVGVVSGFDIEAGLLEQTGNDVLSLGLQPAADRLGDLCGDVLRLVGRHDRHKPVGQGGGE